MFFIALKNALKKNNIYFILIVTENKNTKNPKKDTKEHLRSSRLKRLERQLKANILKRKVAKKNNG